MWIVLYIWSLILFQTWFRSKRIALNILLLHTFHTSHSKNPRKKVHIRFRIGLEKSLGDKFLIVFGIFRMSLLFFLNMIAPMSHRLELETHSLNKCSLVSTCPLKRVHLKDPINPHLKIFSQVRVLLWINNHKNVETLGQIFCFQIVVQIMSLGRVLKPTTML